MRISKVRPLSPLSPLEQDDVQQNIDTSGGELGRANTISTLNQVSPPENTQYHSRISLNGDSGASGDTIRRDDASSQNGELLNYYVAFDLEWNTEANGEKLIYAAFIC